MVLFLWDEFEVLVTTSTISRTLKSIRWSKQAAHRVAAGRHPDLRDLYQYDLSTFEPYHVIYVDESGCDKRVGYRRTGWSPLGVTPIQIARFQRGGSGIIFCLRTRKMASYFHAYTKAPPTVLCSRTTSNNSFLIAADGRNPSQC